MNISKYLIYFLPLALVSGPLISEIIIIFVSLNFLFFSIKNKIYFYYKNNFSRFFLFFYFIINISDLLSSDIFYSLKTSIPYLRYYFFVIAVSYCVSNDNKFIKNLFYSLSFTLICVAISGYVEYFFNYNLFLAKKIAQHRISGLFGDELIIGSYVARLIPLMILLKILLKIKKNIIFNCVLIFIYFIVFLSGERSALLLASISYFSYIFFSSINLYKKIIFLLVTFFLAISFIANNDILKSRLITETHNQIISNKNIYFFSEEHTGHYKAAFSMFLDKPILGHGPKTFRLNCNKENYIAKYSCTTHPHNFQLQLLAEIGIFGIMMTIIFLYSLFLFFKNLTLGFTKSSFVYLPILTFIMPFIPNGNFFNNWLSIISYFSISITIYLIFIKSEKN